MNFRAAQAQHQNFRVLIVITHWEQAEQRERVRDTQVGQSRPIILPDPALARSYGFRKQ
jgi:hypothetical protein